MLNRFISSFVFLFFILIATSFFPKNALSQTCSSIVIDQYSCVSIPDNLGNCGDVRFLRQTVLSCSWNGISCVSGNFCSSNDSCILVGARCECTQSPVNCNNPPGGGGGCTTTAPVITGVTWGSPNVSISWINGQGGQRHALLASANSMAIAANCIAPLDTQCVIANPNATSPYLASRSLFTTGTLYYFKVINVAGDCSKSSTVYSSTAVSPPVDGVCSNPDSHYTCLVGTSPVVTWLYNTSTYTYTWRCDGSNGGSNDSCSETQTPINGVCGSSNGGTFPTAPSSNLCSVGTATTVLGSGPWTWSCLGLYNGSTASCSANKTLVPVNGVCSATHYNCTTGTSYNPVENPTNYTWGCSGSNGGTSTSPTACQELKAVSCTVSLDPNTQNVVVGNNVVFTATVNSATTPSSVNFRTSPIGYASVPASVASAPYTIVATTVAQGSVAVIADVIYNGSTVCTDSSILNISNPPPVNSPWWQVKDGDVTTKGGGLGWGFTQNNSPPHSAMFLQAGS